MPSVAGFEPQPLEAPLNEKARLALRQLANKRTEDYGLSERLKKAIQYLDQAVAPLNDRAVLERQRHDKVLAKLSDANEVENEEERDKFETFQSRVDELTKSMDKSIRSVIDTRVWLEELPKGLEHVRTTSSNTTQSTQRSTQRTQLPTQDATPQTRPFDPDNGDEEIGEDDGPASQPQGPPAYSETPTALLHAALSTQKTKWDVKTLTEKYARDNDYTGFYANRFNAQHPADNAPPMPAAPLWFAAEEGRHLRGSQRAQDDDGGDDEEDDSDLEVAAERVSTKCPLTLQIFEEPVMSHNCKHSFEKQAILQMLHNRNSSEHKPFTAEQTAEIERIRDHRARTIRREAITASLPRGVKCPDCRVWFQEEDLRPNLILQRRAQRDREEQKRKAAAQDEEDDSEEEEDLRGTQRRPVGLGSSPMGGTQRRKSIKREALRLKQERLSGQGRVPNSQPDGLPSGTQMTNSGAMVVDLGDSDEEGA